MNRKDAATVRDDETEDTVDRTLVTTYLLDALSKLKNAINVCRASSDTELRRSTLPQIEKHLDDLTATMQRAQAQAINRPTKADQKDETTFEIRMTPKLNEKLEDQLCTTLFKNAERWILHHLFQLTPYDPTPSVSKRSAGATTDSTVLNVMFNHRFTTEETAEVVSEFNETVTDSVPGDNHEINVNVQQLQTAAAQT